MRKIILASASPRRRNILSKAGIKFEIIESKFPEEKISLKDPHKLTQKLSLEKAKRVAREFKEAVIISADTVVFFEEKILGKPKSEREAFKILKSLSGKKNIVVTGFTVFDTKTKKSTTKSIATKIFMKKYSDKVIERYIATGDPFDKAGAYAIQGHGKKLVERVEGDYKSAVGLPIDEVIKKLKKMEVMV